jgi:hypothetical protein
LPSSPSPPVLYVCTYIPDCVSYVHTCT